MSLLISHIAYKVYVIVGLDYMWPLFLFGRLYSSDINYVTRFSRLRMPHAKTHVATTFDHVPIYVLKIGRLTPIAYGVQQ
jgi:hypothetical protein